MLKKEANQELLTGPTRSKESVEASSRLPSKRIDGWSVVMMNVKEEFASSRFKTCSSEQRIEGLSGNTRIWSKIWLQDEERGKAE